jgi:hypothetical protein
MRRRDHRAQATSVFVVGEPPQRQETIRPRTPATPHKLTISQDCGRPQRSHEVTPIAGISKFTRLAAMPHRRADGFSIFMVQQAIAGMATIRRASAPNTIPTVYVTRGKLWSPACLHSATTPVKTTGRNVASIPRVWRANQHWTSPESSGTNYIRRLASNSLEETDGFCQGKMRLQVKLALSGR